MRIKSVSIIAHYLLIMSYIDRIYLKVFKFADFLLHNIDYKIRMSTVISGQKLAHRSDRAFKLMKRNGTKRKLIKVRQQELHYVKVQGT